MLTNKERDRQLSSLLGEIRLGVERTLVLLSTNPSAPTSIPPPATAESSPSVPPTSADSVPKLAWGKKVGVDFKKFVIQMAKDFEAPGVPADPNWYMACMAFETGETFSPSIKNPGSTAVGLIQFLEKTAGSLGTTTAKLAAMDRMKQLEYVWLYFRNFIRDTGKRPRSLEDVYMVIHWPAAVGKPNSATMYTKGTSAYRVNAGLDINKDGIITKEEAGRLVRAKLTKGMQEEYFG